MQIIEHHVNVNHLNQCTSIVNGNVNVNKITKLDEHKLKIIVSLITIMKITDNHLNINLNLMKTISQRKSVENKVESGQSSSLRNSIGNQCISTSIEIN